MTGIAHLSPGGQLRVLPQEPFAAGGSASFAEILEARASGLVPAPGDRALAFGAMGVFAPSRPAAGEVLARVPEDQPVPRGEESAKNGNAAPLAPGLPERAGEVMGAAHRVNAWHPTPAERNQEPQRSCFRSDPPLTMPAFSQLRSAQGIQGSAYEPADAASPAKPKPEPAGRPQPVALSVEVAEGAARVVARADVLPGAALDRLMRMLRDRGLSLANLRLNGIDIAADHLRVEGGFHGSRSR